MAQRRIEVLVSHSVATPPPDTTSPFVFAQIPAPLATVVSPTTNIDLSIDDLESGVDLSSVVLRVNRGAGFEIAFQGGGFVAPFNGPGSTFTTAGIAGFRFIIDPTIALPEFLNVQIRVVAQDFAPIPNVLDATYSFQTQDLTTPFLTMQTPAPSAVGAPKATNITFKVDDAGSGVTASSINVQVKEGAGAFVNAVVNGVIVAPFSGPISGITASGVGWILVLDRTTDYGEAALVTVQVQAQDPQSNALNTSYGFTTESTLYAVAVDVSFVQKDGGYLVTVNGNIPDGTYIVHVGPNGSIADPICYSAHPGSGNVATARGGVITVAIPPVAIGGPYAFTLEKITGSGEPVKSTNAVLTYGAPQFRSRVLSMRRLLPGWWKTGPRLPEQGGVSV